MPGVPQRGVLAAAGRQLVVAAVFGDAAEVEVTQGMRLRPVEVTKGWRIREGAREFMVEHVDDTRPGEIILTTSEVQM